MRDQKLGVWVAGGAGRASLEGSWRRRRRRIREEGWVLEAEDRKPKEGRWCWGW